VEAGGDRWSKPHVATLSLRSMLELRSNILNGVVLLDVKATEISQIVGMRFLFEPTMNNNNPVIGVTNLF